MQKYESLTLSQVAKIINCAYQTVWRLVISGELVAFKVGKDYRVRADVVDEFMQRPAVARKWKKREENNEGGE